MIRKLALPVTVLVLTLVANESFAGTSSDNRAFSIQDPGPIYYYYAHAGTSGTYRFRTRALTGTMDTVLHVWDPTNGVWMASNDDVASGNCTDLRPRGQDVFSSCKDIYLYARRDPYLVFIHRATNSNQGRCTFEFGLKGQSPLYTESNFPAGGDTNTWGSGQAVSWDANDTLQAAFTAVHEVEAGQPWQGGLLWPVVLVLAGNEKLYRYGMSSTPFTSGGIWGQPNILLPQSSSSVPPIPSGPNAHRYVVGQDFWAEGATYPERYGDGSLKLYRNDYLISGRDPDQDKLGTQLEQALGICPQQSSCPDKNPMDTDNDGLRDDWEVVGGCVFNGCDPTSSDGIALGYYGADPLGRDVFVQVDFMKTSDGSDPLDVAQILASAFQKIRDIYGATQSATDAPKEPVSVFFDYGQLATGGFGGHRIAYQSYLCPNAEIPTDCQQTYGFCYSQSQCASGQECYLFQCVKFGCQYGCFRDSSYLTPYNLEDLVRGGPDKNYLLPLSRRGVFSFFLIAPPLNWYAESQMWSALTLYSSCPSSNLGGNCKLFIPPIMVSRGVWVTIERAAATSFHELGHTFGLRHVPPGTTGASNYVPNHISNMNYYFNGYVDTQDHLDYSSGNHVALTAYVDQGVGCGTPCTSIGGTCLNGRCVKGGLDERAGIGDLFGTDGNDYQSNQLYQLGRLWCMRNDLGYNDGIGPAHLDEYPEYRANIDWNKDGVLQTGSFVGAHLWEACQSFVSDEVQTFNDSDEWGYVTSEQGFSRYGINVLPCMGGFGTPLCSSDEGISCPASCGGENLLCAWGHCIPQGAQTELEANWTCDL